MGRLRPELAAVRRHRARGRRHRLRPARAALARAGPRRPSTLAVDVRAARSRAADLRQHRPAARLARRRGPAAPTTATRGAIVDAFRRHGCFTEYGSPTYYGIDLLALGLWQRPDAPPTLQRDGAAIEAALWTDIARWWHAGLGNLCGPYSRAYGMDLGSYVSGLSLALWCAGLPAPLPPLDADVVPHGHDVCMAPMLEHVGVRVPAAARPAFERFPAPRAVRPGHRRRAPPGGHRLARGRPA